MAKEWAAHSVDMIVYSDTEAVSDDVPDVCPEGVELTRWAFIGRAQLSDGLYYQRLFFMSQWVI